MASVQMLDHLVKVNGLEEVMVRHGLTLPDDLTFIKEQIAGPPDNSISDRSVCVCVCVCHRYQLLPRVRYNKASLDINITLSFLQSFDVAV